MTAASTTGTLTVDRGCDQAGEFQASANRRRYRNMDMAIPALTSKPTSRTTPKVNAAEVPMIAQIAGMTRSDAGARGASSSNPNV